MIPSRKSFSLACLLSIALSHHIQAQTDTVSVYFALDKATGFDTEPLDAQMDVLPLLDGILIHGYADELGTTTHNKGLSQRRADAVAEYLMMQGIARRKIGAIEGKGELKSEKTLDSSGDQSHRRVDVVIPSTERPSRPVVKERKEVAPPPEDAVKPQPSFEIDTVTKKNIVLEGLSFIGGRHFPTPESMPVLYKLVETMKKYPELEIEIQGHICCEYEEFDGLDLDTQEKTLSKNRAKYVYKFLIQEGISATRLSYVGKGSSEPKVFPEKNEEDRQANRRVEIKVTKYP